MRAVAIDTSSRRAEVALWEAGIILARAAHDDRNLHAESVVGLLDTCFRVTGWSRTSIDVCVCGIGPGSFTGVRVGLATAKGLALGLDRPIVGIVSLDAMAWGVPLAESVPAAMDATTPGAPQTLPTVAGHPAVPIVAVVDAGRGQFFGALYGADRRPRQPPAIFRTGELAGFLDAAVEADHLIAVGEVADAAIGSPPSRLAIRTLRSKLTDLPDAGILAELGVARLAVTGPNDLDTLEPYYGRAPDITAPKAG